MTIHATISDAELEARGLPKMAFLDNSGREHADSSASVVAVRRGERGAYPLRTEYTAEQLNSASGVTPEQVEAMRMGSKHGWDCPESYLAPAGLPEAAL